MTLIETWLEEMGTSSLSLQVKEMTCYLAVSEITQANERRISWSNTAGFHFSLDHAKVVSLSCILTGEPGSYKSEAVRFISRCLESYNQLVTEDAERFRFQLRPVSLYPHDKVSNEKLLSTLAKQSHDNAKQKATTSCICIDELINFLNRRDYVEPLLGTLNSLLDQPSRYAVGTHARGDEFIHRPLVSLVAACAPGWFRYLPEALFSGGVTGRILFYGVPYPRPEDYQPLGTISQEGAEEKIGRRLYELPQEPFLLVPESIQLYMDLARDYASERRHPVRALDEWYKRRAILTIRLAACIALANSESLIRLPHMERAISHMDHVLATLEGIWEEVDPVDSSRLKRFLADLVGFEWSEADLLLRGTEQLGGAAKAISMIRYLKETSQLLSTPSGKWKIAGSSEGAAS